MRNAIGQRMSAGALTYAVALVVAFVTGYWGFIIAAVYQLGGHKMLAINSLLLMIASVLLMRKEQVIN